MWTAEQQRLCSRLDECPVGDRAAFRQIQHRGRRSVVVAPAAHGTAHRAQNFQDEPYDDQHDAYRPQDRDLQNESDDERDNAEDDHSKPPGLLIRSLPWLLGCKGLPVGRPRHTLFEAARSDSFGLAEGNQSPPERIRFR
jgi:hypothetical protein